ncbi:S8 family serine peptidase [Streptomyces sp. NBC_00454]|uniref:S8 family serine peptidase n=1 Tax=Streptomyces sp. NBC_00454 TaxID=2975747 RepID=UPI003244317F
MKKALVPALAAFAALVLAAAIPAAAATADTRPASTRITDSWALARITQTGPVPAGQSSYSYTTQSQGEGVNAYIIDSGIDISHPDFEGRASVEYDPFGNGPNDCTGHGTGLAENLGGRTYGVAKKVNLLAVHTQPCGGGGTNQDFINAINWVAAHHKSPAVAVFAHNWNGFGYYGLMNEVSVAINNLAQSGVFVAVSAGNPTDAGWLFPAANQRYAVENPPANASQALVVMGTAPDDTVPLGLVPNPGCNNYKAWSAVGGDIYAPGFPVKTIKEVPNAHNSPFVNDCGTSYAAPMAAGVGALYKATYGDAPSATVKSWITAHATQGAVTNNPPQDGGNTNTFTPNLLLNTGGL